MSSPGTLPFSEYKDTPLPPTMYPNHIVIALELQNFVSQGLATLYTMILNVVVELSYPCVTPHVAVNSSPNTPLTWG